MKHFGLKIFLLLNGVPDPDDTSRLRELLEQFDLASRFQPACLVGVPWADAASKWLEERRNEAISELTLIAAVIAMLAAIVAAARAFCSFSRASSVKVRANRGQELVIGGYIPGSTTFDSLLVGYYEGSDLMYAGRIRNGFAPASRRTVFEFRGLSIFECLISESS
jgi:hypothetical protein